VKEGQEGHAKRVLP